MNRSVLGVLVLLVLIVLPLTVAHAAPEISIKVNGVEVSAEIPPLIVAGRTMVPARTFCEALGCNVVWDQKQKAVLAIKSGRVVKISVGSGIATLNEIPLKNRVPALLIDGRVLVPARMMAEPFGAVVAWNPTARQVLVSLQETHDGMSAKQLFDQSTTTLQEANSYSFSGRGRSRSSLVPDVSGLGELIFNTEISGVVSAPQIYEKDIITSAEDQDETVLYETYSNGTDYYQKYGNSAWEKVELSEPGDLMTITNQKPEAALQAFENVANNAAFADDVLVYGRPHYAVYVKFDQTGFKQYLIDSMVQAAGKDLESEELAYIKSTYTSIVGSMRFDLTYKTYIDKESKTISAFETRSVFKTVLEGQGTTVSSNDLYLSISDMNQPVVIPSMALPKPTK